MKKVLCLITAAVMFCFALAACGTGSSDDTAETVSDPTAEPAAPIDLTILADEMQRAAPWPEMKTATDAGSSAARDFGAISDLSYDRVDAFCLLYASDGTSYELAVIRLKDAVDTPALERSLKKHIESRVEQYRYYMPDQVERAAGAQVVTRGCYAALIMCDDNDAVKAVFEQEI